MARDNPPPPMLTASSSRSRACTFGHALRFDIGLHCIPMWLYFRGGSFTCDACDHLLLLHGVVASLVVKLPALMIRLSSRWECLRKFQRHSVLDLVMDDLYLLWDLARGFTKSSPLLGYRMENKWSRSFFNPLMYCMTESVFLSSWARSAGTTHVLLPSKMLREFVAGKWKAWTLSKNSMPRIIMKSSISTIDKSSFPFHVLSVTCTPRAIPANGLALSLLPL